jgi:hypothetical protein
MGARVKPEHGKRGGSFREQSEKNASRHTNPRLSTSDRPFPHGMILIKDPALPAGTAQAVDADGKLLATLKLPMKGIVPRGTVTDRVSAEDYERVLVTIC